MRLLRLLYRVYVSMLYPLRPPLLLGAYLAPSTGLEHDLGLLVKLQLLLGIGRGHWRRSAKRFLLRLTPPIVIEAYERLRRPPRPR